VTLEKKENLDMSIESGHVRVEKGHQWRLVLAGRQVCAGMCNNRFIQACTILYTITAPKQNML
jgi:hypothetical protein